MLVECYPVMNCAFLSEHLIVGILIYGVAGDCLNLREHSSEKRNESDVCVMLKI